MLPTRDTCVQLPKLYSWNTIIDTTTSLVPEFSNINSVEHKAVIAGHTDNFLKLLQCITDFNTILYITWNYFDINFRESKDILYKKLMISSMIKYHSASKIIPKLVTYLCNTYNLQPKTLVSIPIKPAEPIPVTPVVNPVNVTIIEKMIDTGIEKILNTDKETLTIHNSNVMIDTCDKYFSIEDIDIKYVHLFKWLLKNLRSAYIKNNKILRYISTAELSDSICRHADIDLHQLTVMAVYPDYYIRYFGDSSNKVRNSTIYNICKLVFANGRIILVPSINRGWGIANRVDENIPEKMWNEHIGPDDYPIVIRQIVHKRKFIFVYNLKNATIAFKEVIPNNSSRRDPRAYNSSLSDVTYLEGFTCLFGHIRHDNYIKHYYPDI